MVQRLANRSVWRWLWRRIEKSLPQLVQGDGGYGAFISPLYKLLSCRDTANWGHADKGALRSLISNRQWPQARLFQAGLAESSNCELCVRAGLCDPLDPSPVFKGTLVHRILSCPATSQYRHENAPQWILDLVDSSTKADGTVELSPSDHLLFTRALLKSPEPVIDLPPSEETFVWVMTPDESVSQAHGYVDGSRLDAEHDLHGLCARQGWAIAAFDNADKLVAAAHGVTPMWAEGIHATELWGLLQALLSFDPGCPLLVDCKAVQLGTLRDTVWANAPCRTFARAWGAIAQALEGNSDRVAWMPAHNVLTDFEHKKLSNGDALQKAHIVGNDLVDRLAKQVAQSSAAPRWQLGLVRSEARRLSEAAMWAAKATVFANHCPLETLIAVDHSAKRQFVRDSSGVRVRGKKSSKIGAIADPHITPQLVLPAVNNHASIPTTSSARVRSTVPSAAAITARRARALRHGKLAEAKADNSRLERWLAERSPGHAPSAPASDRFAALRERIAAKQGR